MAWKLYEDAALNTPITSQLLIHQTDFSDNPQTFSLFYGNRENDPGDNQVQRQREATAPGVNQIAISIVDESPGAGHEATEITLALSEAGLDSATPGASLDLGTELLSGASAAVEIFMRVENAVDQVGLSAELGWYVTDVIDEAVQP